MDHNAIMQASLYQWELKGYHREDLIAAWLERQPPFEYIEKDTVEVKQVMPGPLPPINSQTHNRNEWGDFADGSN